MDALAANFTHTLYYLLVTNILFYKMKKYPKICMLNTKINYMNLLSLNEEILFDILMRNLITIFNFRCKVVIRLNLEIISNSTLS